MKHGRRAWTFGRIGRAPHMALVAGLTVASGCASQGDDDARAVLAQEEEGALHEGHFEGIAVAGLEYATRSVSGTTDAAGRFTYREGEEVRFSLGALMLGAVRAKPAVTARDLVATESEADNLLVLLQTLDHDGDLNDGIAIDAATARIVSGYGGRLAFVQTSAAFAADPNVTAMLAELNAAGAFAGADPRPRKLRTARAARELFVRATSARKEVTTQHGTVRGFAANATTHQWLGVRYAKPPLGALRWKPPAALEAWTGTRDAVAWGDQAPQDPRFESNGEGGMSEDCLHLNITAPADARGLPVMVWFHGGAFTILTSNSRGYNNIDGLTTKGVVLVTVNHRLGPFGYLAHPLLVADSDYGGSGNYGQLDLLAALAWVKENIAGFGGDPGNVTIFGQSGGGGKVASLMTSPLAKGLFHKAIVQSGQQTIPQNTVAASIAEAEAIGEALFTRVGAGTVADARALPWTAIVQSDIDAKIPREIYRPSIDHHYLSKTYYETIVEGQPADVPLMIGATSGDYPRLQSGLVEVMPLRSAHTRSPLFVYKFSRVPPGWAKRGIPSGHGGEVPYLFNFPATYVNNYLFDLVLDPATGKRPEVDDLNGNGIKGTDGDQADVLASMAWDARDDWTADQLMTSWTNFAKTGDPSSATLTWSPYTASGDQYVEFGQEAVEAKSGLKAAFPPP